MELIVFLLAAYAILMVTRIFLPPSGEVLFNPFLRIIYKLTEPVLEPMRRRIPSTRTGFDMTPAIAAVILILVRGFLIGISRNLGVTGALLQSVFSLINLLYGILGILFLGVLFVSLGSAYSYSRFNQILLSLTDPFIRPVRRLTGYRERGFDWAPILGAVLLVVLRTVLVFAFISAFGSRAESVMFRSLLGESTYLLVDTLVTFLIAVMIARAIMSWINMGSTHPLVQAVIFYSDPIIRPIHRLIPTTGMGMDFSPMLAVLLLLIIRQVVRQIF